jgi:L-cysteine:1D-myo-inositol 2-amino-2-deoxy-alpha-D-glucopyranoside ligase
MPEAQERLLRWLDATGSASGRTMEEVRQRLDDDLDTPGAIAAVDDAVARGEGVAEAAALLGVELLSGLRLDPPRTVPGPGRAIG